MGFCPGPGWCVPVQRTAAGAEEEEAAPAAGVVERSRVVLIWPAEGQHQISEPTSCVNILLGIL